MAKRGRPKLPDPNTTSMSIKVGKAFIRAAKRYAKANKLRGPSHAIRVAAEKTLRDAGLL